MEEYIFCISIAVTHSLLSHTTLYNTLIVNISTEPLRPLYGPPSAVLQWKAVEGP